MDFRLATEQDRQQVEDLWSYCFEPTADPFFQWYFRRYWQPVNTLCGWENGRLACCTHLNPYTLRIRGANFPVSYIVGLATAPECRQGGVAGQLLRAALREMRTRGHVINILMPSVAGFYRPFGWELCYHQIRYRVPLEDLRKLRDGKGVWERLQGTEGVLDLAAVYDAYTIDLHGYVVRSPKDWQNLLEAHAAEGGQVALLRQKGRPAGYLLYHVQGGTFRVTDFAYIGQEAWQAMLAYAYGHRSPSTHAEWNAPWGDHFYLYLPDPKEQISIYPFMAGRIVDVAQVLRQIQLPGTASGQLRLAITDELADWNQGVWELTASGRRLQVHTGGDEADISCSCAALTLLLFGRLSVQELIAAGQITASQSGQEILENWLPAQKNYINEYF